MRVVVAGTLLLLSAARTPTVATVTRDGDRWTTAGANVFVVTARDLSMAVDAARVRWAIAPSVRGDLIVRAKGRDVALRLEMTRHEFLDANHRRGRTTFADGTTVTVGWDAGTYVMTP